MTLQFIWNISLFIASTMVIVTFVLDSLDLIVDLTQHTLLHPSCGLELIFFLLRYTVIIRMISCLGVGSMLISAIWVQLTGKLYSWVITLITEPEIEE